MGNTTTNGIKQSNKGPSPTGAPLYLWSELGVLILYQYDGPHNEIAGDISREKDVGMVTDNTRGGSIETRWISGPFVFLPQMKRHMGAMVQS